MARRVIEEFIDRHGEAPGVMPVSLLTGSRRYVGAARTILTLGYFGSFFFGKFNLSLIVRLGGHSSPFFNFFGNLSPCLFYKLGGYFNLFLAMLLFWS